MEEEPNVTPPPVKEVYSYDPVTLEYVGAITARQSPLDPPGVYLIPADATEVTPPAPLDGHAQIFYNNEWHYVVDKRGETWWTQEGAERVIDFLGDPAEYGFLAVNPNPEPEPDPIPEEPQIPATPDRVSRRQFKLQLYNLGLLERVEEWVSTQSMSVQIAWADAVTFYRYDDAMQQGFVDLGFAEEEIDQFYSAAALL
jgi:hypothetical protein